MTRSIHASVVTELAKDDFNMVSLLRIGIPVGSPETDIFLNDTQFPITFDSNVYDSSGHILDIGTVSENADVRIGSLRITFSAVDQTYSNLFQTADYIDARVRYYKAILEDDYTYVGQPILMFDGNISGMKIIDNGRSSKLELECASHWANFDVINGRKTNSNSQQAHFSSDLGFEFAAHTVKDIKWGRQ